MIYNRYSIATVTLMLGMLIITSCKGVDEITFTGIDNVILQGLENNKVKFSADVGIHNPSSANFRISEVNLKTSIDGSFIGTLTTNDAVKIKAKTDSAYHTGFTLEIANLVSGASTLYGLQHKKQVTVEMQGYVKARSWLAFRKIDVSEKQIVDMPSFNR